eukprot:gene12695-17022_t
MVAPVVESVKSIVGTFLVFQGRIMNGEYETAFNDLIDDMKGNVMQIKSKIKFDTSSFLPRSIAVFVVPVAETVKSIVGNILLFQDRIMNGRGEYGIAFNDLVNDLKRNEMATQFKLKGDKSVFSLSNITLFVVPLVFFTLGIKFNAT